jgi:hypothetical protein
MVLAQQDRGEAICALREGIARYPSPKMYQALVAYLIGGNEEEEAEWVANSLAEAYPQSPYRYLALADISGSKEHPAEHVERYALQALELTEQHDHQDRLEVAMRLFDVPRQRELSSRLPEEYLEQQPNDARAHMMLAVLLEGANPDRARSHRASAVAALGGNESAVSEAIQSLTERKEFKDRYG